MNIFLTILIVACVIGAVVALVRGLVAFLKATEDDLNSGNTGPSASSLKQNKMMFTRIIFQGAAVLIIAPLLLAKGH